MQIVHHANILQQDTSFLQSFDQKGYKALNLMGKVLFLPYTLVDHPTTTTTVIFRNSRTSSDTISHDYDGFFQMTHTKVTN